MVACGSSNGGGGAREQQGRSSSSGRPDFAGTYNQPFPDFQNTSPNTLSGPSSSVATITVTNVSATVIELSLWRRRGVELIEGIGGGHRY